MDEQSDDLFLRPNRTITKIALLALFAAGGLERDASAQNGVLCQNACRAEGYQRDRIPASKSASRHSELVPARFFIDPANRRFDVQAVRRNTQPGVSVAGHYSKALVPCGTGCTASWLVDRRTGAIIEVPPSSSDAEDIYGVQGRANSDTVRITYGPADGAAGDCRVRNFRINGATFTAIGEFSPAPCP